MTKLLGLPFLASEHGAEVDKLIFYVHLLMGVLFAGWFAYFLYVLFRFRKSSNPKASYNGVQSHASTWIEGAVVVAEAVLLIGFAVPLWAKVINKPADDSGATIIRVMAQQFAWNIRYPGKDGVFGKQDVKHISSGNPWAIDPNDPAGKDDIIPPQNVFYAPVGKPVVAYITSQDVIHSFKVAPFRITQDAIPGLVIPTWFKPTQVGRYLVNCAQLCGNSHAVMRGYFNVVPQEEFDQWIAEKSSSSAAPATSFE